jgi:hypothetical protein
VLLLPLSCPSLLDRPAILPYVGEAGRGGRSGTAAPQQAGPVCHQSLKMGMHGGWGRWDGVAENNDQLGGSSPAASGHPRGGGDADCRGCGRVGPLSQQEERLQGLAANC